MSADTDGGTPIALVPREVPPRAAYTLEQAGIHPLLARLYAARGVRHPQELDEHFQHLIPPSELTHADRAASLLADAIAQGRSLCVVADYDCDGATACAVALRGLKMLGARANALHYVCLTAVCTAMASRRPSWTWPCSATPHNRPTC